MATETMSKQGWLLKEKRELCVRVYNSSIINGTEHEEALETSIKVIDRIFDKYGEENLGDIRPL